MKRNTVSSNAAGVSVAVARCGDLSVPDYMELRDDGRPVIVAYDSTNRRASEFCEELVKQQKQSIIRLNLPSSESVDSKQHDDNGFILSDYQEKTLGNMIDTIKKERGPIGGFVFVVSKANHDLIRWGLLAAKSLSPDLNRRIKNGRTFFVVCDLVKESGKGNDLASILDSQRGSLSGLCKTLDLEWPAVFCRYVALSNIFNGKKAARLVGSELHDPDLTIREVEYTSDGTRTTRSASDIDVSSPASPRNCDTDVWLVSGGGRGITPICMAALASRSKGGTFVLLGRSALENEPAWARSAVNDKQVGTCAMAELKRRWKEDGGPKPTPSLHRRLVKSVCASREIRASIAKIEGAGGKAFYVTCDVTSKSQVADAVQFLRSKNLRITGIVHASGVLRDKRIENKTAGDFNVVYGVKVGGLSNVLDALREDLPSLKNLVVFSSLAGFHGNIGQSDYAMANEALARMSRQFSLAFPQCAACALCYGPWDGGMVTPALKRHFRSLGVQIIPREGGAELTASLIRSVRRGTSRQFLIGNWGIPPGEILATGQLVRRVLASGLDDHAIQGKRVLPFTVAMSFAASTVAKMHPGMSVLGVRDCRLFGGAAGDKGTVLELRMEAKGDRAVRCKMFARGPDAEELKPAYSCDVVFGALRDQRSDPPPQLTPDPDSYRTNVYDFLFHGRTFRSIDAILHIHSKGLVARCVGNAPRGVLTDVLLQLPLVWVHENRGHASLPSSIGRIEYLRPLPHDRPFYASLTITSCDGPRIVSDCSLTDASGNVYVRGVDLTVTASPGLRFDAVATEADSATASKHAKDASEETVDTRIAVVGMSVTYAGAPNLEAFWETLMRGDVNTKPITPSQLRTSDLSGHLMPFGSKYAEGIVNPLYGSVDDATERDMLLRLAKRALANCKSNVDLESCGIVNGSLNFPQNDGTQQALLDMYLDGKASRSTQTTEDPATFVARALGLGPRTPRYSIDAACATALYVLKLARDALLRGEVSTILASAATKPEPFFVLSGFSAFQALPPKGRRSAPFQKDSRGLTPGEGGAVFVLKRLADAVRDGDRIYGVLRDVHLSNAGRGLPLKPDRNAELTCMRGAYSRELPPETVEYVECHATGTSQGDACEISAIEQLFGAKPPMIGSTKGAFGHTLVAAGFAGMAKLLLAMNRGMIPPTPLIDGSGSFMSERVVAKPTPWTSEKKRGAVSAFGFGGTNAHAVFDGWNGTFVEKCSQSILPRRDEPVFVSGLGALFGGDAKDIQGFETALYRGTRVECALPPKRWRGADPKVFGLQDPSTVRGCFISHVDVDFKRLRLPLVKEDRLIPQQLVALTVIERAIEDAGGNLGPRTAVLVGLETEMELYRHRARCALKERGASRAEMDRLSDVGTSISYTSNIGNIVATRVAALHGYVGPAFTVTEGERSADRALSIARAMLASGEIDAAVVAGVDLCASAEALWRRNRGSAKDIGEGCAAIVLRRERAGAYAMLRPEGARVGQDDDVIVVNDALDTVGNVGCATGAAALVKAALCLSRRFVPNRRSGWILGARKTRVASVRDGILLEEVPSSQRRRSMPETEQLLVFEGNSVEDIREKLKTRRSFVRAVRDTARAESRAREEEQASSPPTLALCLVATPSTYDAERARALKGLKSDTKSWRSPSGSYFTADPLRSARVAFVYGDGSAPYDGLGQDLHRICPELHDIMASRTATLPVREASNVVDVFRNGVYWSVCLTEIAKRVLGLRPTTAFGLSLGEISALFAFSEKNCKMSETVMKRLSESAVWRSDLAGTFDTLRKAWGVSAPNDVWAAYVLGGTSRDVLEKSLSDDERVRLLIVNDDSTMIIGGVPSDCERLAKRLGKSLLPLPRAGRMVAHCAETRACADAIAKIHDGLEIPCRLSRQNVAEVYTEIADFPKSVRAADADVFVEVGPGDARTQAIRCVLSGTRHLAVAMDAEKKRSAWSQLITSAAQLRSHQIAGVRVDRLCDPAIVFASEDVSSRHRLQRVVEINEQYPLIATSSNSLEQELAYHRSRAKAYKGPLVWDFDDLLQYAEGDIAPVFNKRLSGEHPPWSLVDSYKRRVRLPQREYLLVSRVTHMKGETGKFEAGATMTTEYDLPPNGALSEGGDVPWAVLVESGQCDLMLISYLGIDFQCRGDRVYRLLNTTLKFYGVAQEGQTLKYDIRIDGFAKRGKEISMFFFSYDCFCDGKLLIEMRGGCAGFFTDAELAAGKGIVRTAGEIRARERTLKKRVDPFLVAPSSRVKLDASDMVHLSQCGHTDGWGKVLGPTAKDVRYKLCARKMLMIDRVVEIDPRGGAYGLGRIVGEKDLAPEHWYFPCHFKNDEVMAGSLVSDGCSQLLKVYMVWLGLHKTTKSLIFRPVKGAANKVRCRGQISPHRGKLVYVMEIREMGFDSKTMQPYAIADVDIVDVLEGQSFDLKAFETTYGRGDPNRKIVVDFKGIALTIESEPSETHPLMTGKRGSATTLKTKKTSIPKELLRYGTVSTALKNRYSALTWHPLAGVNGNPTPGFTPTRFPPRPIAFLPFPNNPNDRNHTPGVLPLSWYNMSEFMCNKVSKCLGDEFAIFDDSTTSRSPAWDLALVTRVLSVSGLERAKPGRSFYGVDTNPSKGTMIAQFDCPKDAWFFGGSSSDDLMPYSILMEIGLQTAGILTSWVKAPLTMKRKNILFRNLDATATLTKTIGGPNGLDLRNKIITNRSVCTGYSMLGDMAIHRFTCELLADDEVFYRVETSFGWFIPDVFEKQVGLDQGKKLGLWHERENVAVDATYELPAKEPVTSPSMQRRSNQTRFLDRASVCLRSGKYGKGYVHGSKNVNKRAWFFSCHFWCDSVMPGSLGVESMLQCVEYYCGSAGLGRDFASPRFVHEPGTTKWKYRGQLTPKNSRMDTEVHIKSIARGDGTFSVVADGYLYVDGLRVYEAIDLRVSIIDGKRARPSLRSALLDLSRPVDVTKRIRIPACAPKDLGSSSFMKTYGVRYPLYTGAMAKGIASAELVVAAGKEGMLASFGAGGLPIGATKTALDTIQRELPNGPYAVNLIHSPDNDSLERDNVDLFLKRGVRVVEASAFMKLTPHVVRYRVAGLVSDGRGGVTCKNRIIFKLSRVELARMALSAPPKTVVAKLVAQGLVTAEQASLASRVPMCDDVAVEADSGGHTDRRPLHVLFPLIVAERNRIAKGFAPAANVRVGAGGGVGTPDAAHAAFALGADFVVTGSINQIAREAGTSDHVRSLLSKATYADVTMAPAADMFVQGVKLQVLKRGTLFPGRAEWLWKLFCENESLSSLPEKVTRKLEKTYFRQTIAEQWEDTKAYYLNRLRDADTVMRAERDSKLKMSLVFRAYLSRSSRWANEGDKSRKFDYQIWCGPCMGAFNDFVRGSQLDPDVSGRYPSVVDINRELMLGAAFRRRCDVLSMYDRAAAKSLAGYEPGEGRVVTAL